MRSAWPLETRSRDHSPACRERQDQTTRSAEGSHHGEKQLPCRGEMRAASIASGCVRIVSPAAFLDSADRRNPGRPAQLRRKPPGPRPAAPPPSRPGYPTLPPRRVETGTATVSPTARWQRDVNLPLENTNAPDGAGARSVAWRRLAAGALCSPRSPLLTSRPGEGACAPLGRSTRRGRAAPTVRLRRRDRAGTATAAGRR